MNLFVSLLPVLFQLFFGYRDGNQPTISSKHSVIAPMMACDRRSDSLELVKFYNATGGPNWWKKWDMSKPISSWHGVELDGGCVVSIDLEDTVENNTCCNGSGNNLVGTIISVNLPFLKFLDLGKNKLTGVIPNLDMFPNLEYLDLHLNKLSGVIPNFDKLPKLTLMDLGANQLISPIPNFDKLLSLTKLVLDENQFAGTIPNFDKLPNLSTLTISINSLSGSIPNFDKLPNLKILGLVANQLTGTIPNFNNLPLLESLQLRINKLTGPIPNFDKLPNLVDLELSNNNLTGQIPEFDKLTRLQSIGIRANQLNGVLPTFSKCPDIIGIDPAENNLSGYLPDFTTYLPDLSSISFKNNKYSFSGIIQNLIKIQSHVETLLYDPQQKIYSDTTITISPNTNYILNLLIDDTVTTSTYFWYKNGVQDTIIKGRNKLPFTPFTSNDAGTYTVKITNPLAPQLTLESHPIRLVASPSMVCNRQSDSLELVKFYYATGGDNWYKKWDLKKPMKTWWGISQNSEGCIIAIRLNDTADMVCCAGNNLTGPLISLNLPDLKELWLAYNKLSGSIPDFENLPNLDFLHLSNNRFTGSIPNLDKTPLLGLLYLNSNQLTGIVPNFDKLINLGDLQLYDNLLSGSIPNFNSLINLNKIYLFKNNLNGSIPNFSNLTDLEQVLINDNNLSGTLQDHTLYNHKLSYFIIQNNKLTFSGLIKNIQKIKNLTDKINIGIKFFPFPYADTMAYAPQQKIYSDTTITISSNTNYTLDLLIDDTVTTSTYAWFKDGAPYRTIKGSNKLPFTPFTINEAGTYTVKITNPLAPQLTLESWPIRLITAPQMVCDRRSDSLELVRFYNATGGPNWTSNWDLTKPISTPWFGIMQNISGCVSEIILRNNNLKDSLILLNLPDLSNLTLASNQLVGKILNFDKLPELRRLELGGNQLEGEIPNFDKLPLLGELGLSNNNLSETIPNFDKLPNLGGLALSNNRLSGNIPNFNKVPLIELDLSENNLIGPLLDNSLTNPKLSRYWLFQNKLTFSDLIQNLKRVKKLTDTINTQKGLYDSLIYAPQQKIYSDTTITVTPNTNYTLDLLIDDTVTTSTYTWYKNGFLDTVIIGKNKLPFTPFTSNDVGTYIVKITNPLAPQLTLESWPIRIISSENIRVRILDENKFCSGDPQIFPRVLIAGLKDTNGISKYLWEGPGIQNSIFYPNLAGPGSHAITFNLVKDGISYKDTAIFMVGDGVAEILNGTSDLCGTNEILYRVTTTSGPFTVYFSYDNNKKGRVTTSFSGTLRINPGVNDSIKIDSILDVNGCKLLIQSTIKNNTFYVRKYDAFLVEDSISVKFQTSTFFNLLSNDRIPNLDSIIVFISKPLNGTINYSRNSGNGNFIPNQGYIGMEIVNYIVCSANCPISCKSSNIIFKVTADCQTTRIISIMEDLQKVSYQTSKLFDVLENDNILIGTFINVMIENPKNGTIIYSQSTGKGTYTPNQKYSGKEILNYTICSSECPGTCKSSTITFEVEGPCGDRNSLVLPNIIFPTGSGANRYFIVEAITKCPDSWGPKTHKLQVFNRWGDLVYKNDNYVNDWDGTNTAGQPLPEGTYYYLLDLGSLSAPIKGYVVIVR